MMSKWTFWVNLEEKESSSSNESLKCFEFRSNNLEPLKHPKRQCLNKYWLARLEKYITGH